MSMALEAHVPGILPPVSFNWVGLTEPALKKMQGDFADIIKGIVSHTSQLRSRLINCTTVEEFRSLLEKGFQSYLDLNMAITNVVIASNVDPIEYAHMAQESLGEMQDEFTANAQMYLGEDTYQELLFCISTLRSAVRWLPRLQSVPPSDPQKDQELASQFFIANSFVSLHLDCLKLAVSRNQTLNPEILGELMTAIRRSVMVYSFARAGLDLRDFPASRYPEKIDCSWDSEDEALAKAE